ncbi:hypothetical protein ABZ946_34040 [Streptomyces sp. NPDC046324]|uniref:hypothetical protein n=1 Tax=Streptomyces sp. NPDC046324 TaxID=3154915 RepID=UPI003402A53E
MDTLSVEYLDDLELVDHYREAVVEVIAAKAEHRAPAAPEGADAPAGQVVDLMAALEESVAKAKASRGESVEGGHATVHAMPKPKKKAAKKTPAKKTARKRAS